MTKSRGVAKKVLLKQTGQLARKNLAAEPKARVTAKNLDWEKLLSAVRFNDGEAPKRIEGEVNDHRVPHERDFDRVVFSAPVRRLKDKTQVFPLDFHDGVRTRLTHSLEVSNLARSMGVAIAARLDELKVRDQSIRTVPALLGAVALAHDLGNPPFGHQGEVAIRQWADRTKENVRKFAGGEFDAELYNDFLRFEGNAQGFRILARLQHQNFRSGLRLTASTLAAFMKYPWGSNHGVARKKGKFGYFQSEKDVYDWARQAAGLKDEQRHPLSYVMEVCDDIAYSVLDVEDAIKKGLVGVAALISYIEERDDLRSNPRCVLLLDKAKSDLAELNRRRIPKFASDPSKPEDKDGPLAITEIRDSMIELIRTYAIGLMVSDAVDDFVLQLTSNAQMEDISKRFDSATLMKAFKDFAKDRIYKHPDVLRAELAGHQVIPALMDAFWRATVNVKRGVASKHDEYVFATISPNYVRVCQEAEALKLPDWYRMLQLVCDQVAGMTDSYCVRLHASFRELGIV